jgi:hypothetical protein
MRSLYHRNLTPPLYIYRGGVIKVILFTINLKNIIIKCGILRIINKSYYNLDIITFNSKKLGKLVPLVIPKISKIESNIQCYQN